MIKVKTLVGMQSYVDKNNNRKCIMHYTELSDKDDFIGCEVGTLTADSDFGLSIGDNFKAYYDKGQYWDSASRTFKAIPILADIVIVPKK